MRNSYWFLGDYFRFMRRFIRPGIHRDRCLARCYLFIFDLFLDHLQLTLTSFLRVALFSSYVVNVDLYRAPYALVAAVHDVQVLSRIM